MRKYIFASQLINGRQFIWCNNDNHTWLLPIGTTIQPMVMSILVCY